jgi:D-alanyl-D-alanine carboxypeptidase
MEKLRKVSKGILWALIFILCFMAVAPVAMAKKSTESSTESSTEETTKEIIGEKTKQTKYITAADWPKAPKIEAGGAVLIDAETGQVLYAKKADTCFYPASITKIMTALLALENSSLKDKVTFEGEATTALPEGYVTVGALPGEKMSMKDWLYSLLLLSANDAANAIAVHVSGSISDFADLMNERAAELGAKHTHFTNPSGLHETTHYTTPYDMAMIMKECVKNEDFLKIAGEKIYTVKANNKRKEDYTFVAKHKMLFSSNSQYYEYCKAGKTGYTTPARNTLVTYAEKDGKKLICCVMDCGAGVQYESTRALFEYGFDNFEQYNTEDDDRYTLENQGIFSGFEDQNQKEVVSIEVVENQTFMIPKGVKAEELDTSLEYLDEEADENHCFAQVVYTYEGTQLGVAKLKLETVDKEETTVVESTAVQDAQENGGQQEQDNKKDVYVNVWVACIVCILIVIVIIILVCFARKKKAGTDTAEKDSKEDEQD